MSIVTSQQLSRYYEQYKNTEVTFNKQVAVATGLVNRNVYFKVLDRQVPCIVFSASMTGARAIATVAPAVVAALKQANNHMALRWCFKQPEKVEPITFFVTCRPTGVAHYAAQHPDLQMITVEFTQRSPDDLILILGTLLEANANAQRRRDERIIVSPETLKKLGLESREATLVVDARAHRCVLRDLSFGGAKIAVSGSAEAFTGKQVSLKVMKADRAGEILLPGAVRRVDEVGGRNDILALGIEYAGDPGMGYKLIINSYLSSIRKPTTEAAKPTRLAATPSGISAATPGGISPAATSSETPAADLDGPTLTPEDAPSAEGNGTPNG